MFYKMSLRWGSNCGYTRTRTQTNKPTSLHLRGLPAASSLPHPPSDVYGLYNWADAAPSHVFHELPANLLWQGWPVRGNCHISRSRENHLSVTQFPAFKAGGRLPPSRLTISVPTRMNKLTHNFSYYPIICVEELREKQRQIPSRNYLRFELRTPGTWNRRLKEPVQWQHLSTIFRRC
jgi:hypothetical protein